MGFIHRRISGETGERYEQVHCDECDCELEPVFAEHALDEQGHWRYLQPDEGLLITFGGGYGMFIDPMLEPEPCLILCGPCATALARSHKAIGRLLARYNEALTPPRA